MKQAHTPSLPLPPFSNLGLILIWVCQINGQLEPTLKPYQGFNEGHKLVAMVRGPPSLPPSLPYTPYTVHVCTCV